MKHLGAKLQRQLDCVHLPAVEWSGWSYRMSCLFCGASVGKHERGLVLPYTYTYSFTSGSLSFSSTQSPGRITNLDP